MPRRRNAVAGQVLVDLDPALERDAFDRLAGVGAVDLVAHRRAAALAAGAAASRLTASVAAAALPSGGWSWNVPQRGACSSAARAQSTAARVGSSAATAIGTSAPGAASQRA